MAAGTSKRDELYQEYVQLSEPHIASYDYFVKEGLQRVVKYTKPVQVEHPVTKKIYQISLSRPALGCPVHELAKDGGRIFPRECREMKLSYTSTLQMDVHVNRVTVTTKSTVAQRASLTGRWCTVWVRSQSCVLCNMREISNSELYRRGEEANDFGGYFIAGGIEKVIRMLFAQKRNHILAFDRPQFQRNGPLFTSKATVFRSVRDDEIGSVIRCHQLRDDTVSVGVVIGTYRFFLPAGVLLRALGEANDRELLEELAAACPSESGVSHAVFVAKQAEQCLTQVTEYGLLTQHEAIEFLGSYYRSPMECSATLTDYDVGLELLNEHIFPHLSTLKQKFDLLIQMIHKLYAFCNSECQADNPDSLATQEAVLPGYILMKMTHDVLKQYLEMLRTVILRQWKKTPEKTDLEDTSVVTKLTGGRYIAEAASKMLVMIKTGRFVSQALRDIGQNDGLTVVAERINFLRYISHFRAIHRGAAFTEMKTTRPRKLLPDGWGFVCPVHTPDGPPCGLLLHLTGGCRISVTKPDRYEAIHLSICKVLAKNGMVAMSSNFCPPPLSVYLKIMLDGHVVGYVSSRVVEKLVQRLRWVKAVNYAFRRGQPVPQDGNQKLDLDEQEIPYDMEVAYVPDLQAEMFPGVFLSTVGGRLCREVVQVKTGLTEIIGPLEQQHLMIHSPDGSTQKDIAKTDASHREIHTKGILSILASLTPFSEFNQSPRNMYQCQMAKQTMGTPCLDFEYRPENKLYRLQTPQSPICRSQRYREYHLDNYPAGTNAVVAVISYTGYDMEDAMILNEASIDRGFARGCIYKTDHHFLDEEVRHEKSAFLADTQPAQVEKKRMSKRLHDTNQLPRNIPVSTDSEAAENLGVAAGGYHVDSERIDADGLPYPGTVIYPDQAFCSYITLESDNFRSYRLKGDETAIVDQVTVVGNNKSTLSSANIRFRVDRTPMIGDKFASRAGQKGILSWTWADVDFPFCASTGMRPDLIINPHAFPSRMTIGMLVESITSKAAALQGCFVDCSPFQNCDDPEALDKVELFGEYLEKAGFSRGGQETMTNGITGEEMECDIYIGLVYYQRLRHMVSDKYQCRATGPINALTKQPVKGRKMGGGIRFGEMERDSVLSHASAYHMVDRLMHCSDMASVIVCQKCGSIIATLLEPQLMPDLERRMLRRAGGRATEEAAGKTKCRCCKDTAPDIEALQIPHVLGVLASELVSVNIDLRFETPRPR